MQVGYESLDAHLDTDFSNDDVVAGESVSREGKRANVCNHSNRHTEKDIAINCLIF